MLQLTSEIFKLYVDMFIDLILALDICTNRNLIQEDIKRRLISGNACCHSVQNVLSSRLLSKNKNQNIQNYNFACGSVCIYVCMKLGL
jgi:hypothetical protein